MGGERGQVHALHPGSRGRCNRSCNCCHRGQGSVCRGCRRRCSCHHRRWFRCKLLVVVAAVACGAPSAVGAVVTGDWCWRCCSCRSCCCSCCCSSRQAVASVVKPQDSLVLEADDPKVTILVVDAVLVQRGVIRLDQAHVPLAHSWPPHPDLPSDCGLPFGGGDECWVGVRICGRFSRPPEFQRR